MTTFTSMAAVGLVRPKTPANIGAVLRAAGCYGAKFVAIEGERGHRAHSHVVRAPTDTAQAFRSIPTVLCDDLLGAMPVGCVPVAVDLVPGAVSLVDFEHPRSAFYIFGPEDGTLGQRHIREGMPRVMIPTAHCMNLAATVNVVLYDRLAKAGRSSVRSAA